MYKLKVFSLFFLYFYFLSTSIVFASQIYDNNAGAYVDDFSDALGIVSKSKVGINSGVLQLENATNSSFVVPYSASGEALLGSIAPSSVAKWGSVTLNSNIPPGTSVRFQIWTLTQPYPDSLIPGNSLGFSLTADNQVIDISKLPPLINGTDGSIGTYDNKIPSLRIKIFLGSTDVNYTPSINSAVLTWTTRQGNLASTTLAVSDWPKSFADKFNTKHINALNSQIYPVFEWATVEKRGCQYSPAPTIYNGQLIVSTGYCAAGDDRVYGINLDTGNYNWEMPFTSYGNGFIIGANGTAYHTDGGNDTFKAIDLDSQNVKWTYNFVGGHSGNDIFLADDGTVYSMRESGGIVTLYAMNADGSLKYSQVISSGLYSVTPLLGLGDIIYFGSTANTYDAGKLYAFNIKTRAFLWSVDMGPVYTQPIMGSDGVIYVGECQRSTSGSYKIYAINLDGTIKWQSNPNGDTDFGYCNSMSLRSDGVIVAARQKKFAYNFSFGDATSSLQFIDAQTGSLISSRTITSAELAFTDKSNGLYFSNSTQANTSTDWYTELRYADKNFLDKWWIRYGFNDGGLRDPDYLPFEVNYPLIGYSFAGYSQSGASRDSTVIGDSRGWLYGVFSKQAEDVPYTSSDVFTRFFALSPWTLTSTLSSDTVAPGDKVSFQAITSMKNTNPLFGGNNAMQVVLDTGEKVPLYYNGSDGRGSTVWVGSYNLPSNYSLGTHSYTLEAAQTYLVTDIPVHFDSTTTESQNTGIVRTGSFKVQNSGLLFSSAGPAINSNVNTNINSPSMGHVSSLGVAPNSNILVVAATSTSLKNVTQSNQINTTKSFTSFKRVLKIGMSGSDVAYLQSVLAKDLSVYPEGLVTSYFGRATQKAVQKFQKLNKIANQSDSGWGIVGPKTQKVLLETFGF